MLSKKQRTIIENMKSNHDVLLSSDAEIKNVISKHKDEKYFPSDIILSWYNRIKELGYDAYILYNEGLDSLYVVFRSKNEDVLYFIVGMESSRKRGKILLLNIHPFYYDVFNRDVEYEKADIKTFTLETLTKDIVEDSITKCDKLYNKYINLIEFYWNKANDTLKNLWKLKKTDPIYKHMQIDQKGFCKEDTFFNAALKTNYFIYEYVYFRHESKCKVKIDYNKWKANGDKGQKLLEKIKKDTLI